MGVAVARVGVMMRLFIDCEFNGFKGELISIGIISEDGHEFYEVLECQSPIQWVAENVMPILRKPPIANKRALSAALFSYLYQFPTIHVVADWPEDIAHFCDVLITGPGERISTPPLTMEIVRIDAASELPHNAIADARGIRAAILAAV